MSEVLNYKISQADAVFKFSPFKSQKEVSSKTVLIRKEHTGIFWEKEKFSIFFWVVVTP